MATITGVEVESQDAFVPDVSPARKVGIEVVQSPSIPKRFYSGPRPGRPTAAQELSVHDRVMLLRGQLRLLRLRAEAGMFVSPDAIERAERIASSLGVAA